MTVTRAAIIVSISTAVCGLVGLLTGWGLGRFAPEYYYRVLPPRPGVPYDPVSLGVGLGVTQGVVAGIVIGAVLVIVGAIVHRRRDVAEMPFASRL